MAVCPRRIFARAPYCTLIWYTARWRRRLTLMMRANTMLASRWVSEQEGNSWYCVPACGWGKIHYSYPCRPIHITCVFCIQLGSSASQTSQQPVELSSIIQCNLSPVSAVYMSQWFGILTEDAGRPAETTQLISGSTVYSASFCAFRDAVSNDSGVDRTLHTL